MDKQFLKLNVRSHPVHLLGAKPPLSLKPSDAPGEMCVGQWPAALWAMWVGGRAVSQTKEDRPRIEQVPWLTGDFKCCR